MRKALVVGNLAWDDSFAVAALPAPGASIPARALSGGAGGKGANQAVALARALGEPGLVGLVAALGGDLRGHALRAALTSEGLALHLVEYGDGISDLSIILREESGENAVITTQDCAQSLMPREILPHLRGDLLVMQGNLRPDVTEAVLHAAQGMVRVLNPSPLDGITAQALAMAEIIVANEVETQALGGAEALSRRAALVRTRGPDGAELWLEGALCEQVPAPRVTPADPTGAGDCFLGALIGAMMRRGATWPDAGDIRIACWAGAMAVARWGTQTAFPSRAEFARAFE